MREPPFSLPAAELELVPGTLEPEQVIEGAPGVSELVPDPPRRALRSE